MKKVGPANYLECLFDDKWIVVLDSQVNTVKSCGKLAHSINEKNVEIRS